MELTPHIIQLLKALAQFDPVVVEEEDAHRLRFERDTKVTEILWPRRVGEIFFDFIKGGEVLLAESIEYYQNETQLQQAEDVARVTRNFLLNEVKVVQSGPLLKRRELQSYRSGKWLSVFESAAQ